MRTYKRICIKNHSVTDGENILNIYRGKEYITSKENEGSVTVFSNFWALVPSNIFAGEEIFTKGK